METEARKATEKQLSYIQHLRRTQGKESLELAEDLSFQEASSLISDLMGGPKLKGLSKPLKINEARLGMVLKECFRFMRNGPYDIYNQHRDLFKKEVLRTYYLFTEIEQAMEQAHSLANERK